MASWPAAWEEQFSPAVIAQAAAYGIPADLALGLVAHESGFNAGAYREDSGGRISYGLTQVLYPTAQGEGYTGTAAGLFDPATNLRYGLSYLAGRLARHPGDPAAALSEYNGGARPSSGYGARLANGTFRNQAYVDAVLAAAAHFQSSAPAAAGFGWIFGLALLGAAFAAFRRKR